ncbi:alpha/beta hydrolase [Pontibacter arcticus]|nr:alpha/beta hydrolase [Pontibacter arcticus]
MLRKIYFLLILLITSCAPAKQTAPPALITWQDIAAMPTPAYDAQIKYGTEASQFGELRLPAGKGKFPVVVVVHGGCWLSAYNLQYMSHVSEALRKAGYATWNIEFRRVGETGGGWPGTFQDVAAGTDYLRELAKKYPLDLDRVAVIGHSAGGHLALWLAARTNLKQSSPLYSADPLPINGVVTLAGITDLKTYSEAEGSCNSAVEKLIGGSATQFPERYAEASPIELLPLQTPVRLVQGAKDPIVPVSQAESFATKAGNSAEVILLDQAGHFELVAPQSEGWPKIKKALDKLLN